MLSRTHSPQKVLPITHNKTHTHSTSNITLLSSPLSKTKKKNLPLYEERNVFSASFKVPSSSFTKHAHGKLLLQDLHFIPWLRRILSGMNQGRFRLVLAVLVVSVSGRYGPILAESARIEAELTRIEPSRCESEEKKKLRRGTDALAAVSDAAPCVGLRCGTLPAASMLHSSKVPCSWT